VPPNDRASAPLSAAAPAQPPRFTLVRVPGDGSCLFRALAQGDHALANGGALLSKTGLLAAGFDVRRRVCAALTARRAETEPFIDCPFPAYVDAMSMEGTWGGEPELAAAPDALRRPVCVYEATARGPLGGPASLRKVSAYGVQAYPATPPVCLLFSGAHYDLLLQKDVEDDGGWLMAGF
jgi:OTU domain-containing protein 6